MTEALGTVNRFQNYGGTGSCRGRFFEEASFSMVVYLVSPCQRISPIASSFSDQLSSRSSFPGTSFASVMATNS